MRQRISAPMVVDFNLTNRCNLKCLFCYANAGNGEKKDELSFDEIINILSELNELNVPLVRLSGGEPMIREDFLDILKKCEAFDFNLCINTNATLIEEKHIPYLKMKKLKSIGVSLDSYNESIHNKLRGNSTAYQKAIDGIKLLIKNGLEDKLSVTITLTNENTVIEDVIHHFELMQLLGVSQVSFQYAIPVGRGDSYLDCSPEYDKWKVLVIWLFSQKETIKEKYNISFSVNVTNESDCKFEFFLPFIEEKRMDLLEESVKNSSEKCTGKGYISCEAGNITIAISSTGKVYPCELMMKYAELEVGDLRRDSFKKIWDGSVLLNEIRNMKMQDLDGYCSVCEFNDSCGGGCRASAYVRRKKLNDCDTRCPKVKESIKQEIVKLAFNDGVLSVRKEFDGYYFSHPETLKHYKFNELGFLIFSKMLERERK